MKLTNAAAVLVLALTACNQAKSGDALGDVATDTAATTAPTSAVRSGPFGFDMGEALDDIAGKTKLDQPGIYSIGEPPKPHPDFANVSLKVFPTTGVCSIRGLGKDIENDATGAGVRAKVDDLAEALATKYGKGTLIDACSAGSYGCGNQFWMMYLQNGERAYGYKWETQNQAMKDAGIGTIYLAAEATDINTSYPLLVFYSAKSKECKAAEKAASASAL